MTRRDRYALALALECLRTPPKVTRVPMYALHALPEEIREAWEIARYEVGVPHRLLRARLALLLRVMLRVDAWERDGTWPGTGEASPYDVTSLPPDHWSGDGGGRWSPYEARVGTFYYRARHIRPLWEIAAREAGR
jgi:hypothetical protein